MEKLEPNPLVSVIVPCFNAGEYLNDSIGSLLSQTYTNWEGILVDDGSIDNTFERCKEFAKMDRRIRVFQLHNNCGPSTARNLGIHQAQGALIAFLDADDVWLEHKLEEQVKLMLTRPDVGFCTTLEKFVQRDLSQHPDYPVRPRLRGRMPIADDIISWSRSHPIDGSSSGVMLRMSLLEKTGLWAEDMRCSEDVEFWYKLSIHSKFARVDKALTLIRIRDDKSSYYSVSMYAQSWFQLSEKIGKVASDKDHVRIVNKNFREEAANAVVAYLAQGEYMTALSWIRRGFHLSKLIGVRCTGLIVCRLLIGVLRRLKRRIIALDSQWII